MDLLNLHDLVALTEARPAENLRRGEIGVIIDIGPNDQYLLEFVDHGGKTYATPTVSAHDVLKVYLQPSLVA
jgi:Domain of unknown function (DUF4926)